MWYLSPRLLAPTAEAGWGGWGGGGGGHTHQCPCLSLTNEWTRHYTGSRRGGQGIDSGRTHPRKLFLDIFDRAQCGRGGEKGQVHKDQDTIDPRDDHSSHTAFIMRHANASPVHIVSPTQTTNKCTHCQTSPLSNIREREGGRKEGQRVGR